MDRLLLYIVLMVMNVIVGFYEVLWLKFEVKQTVVARVVAQITALPLVFLFIGNHPMEKLAISIVAFTFGNMHPSVVDGIKLAIVAPHMYLGKLFICNVVFIPLCNRYNYKVKQFNTNQLGRAYLYALIFSFLGGMVYGPLHSWFFSLF